MFTGKTALVTGATSGIGLGIARHFAAQGANIILNGFGDAAEIEALRAELARTHGVQVRYQGADMSQQADIEAMMADVLAEFGCIDLLVNNAGIQHVAPVDEFPVDKWNAILAINLGATFHTVRLALPAMKAKGWGRIVNIASRAAYRGDSPAHWHYAASKAGMVAMTKSIARAYAKDGIYAFAICPGFTMTGMAEDYMASRGGDKLLADIPLGKVADPEEVAAIAKFCSLDAPPSMTGAVLDVNGASYVR